MLKWKLHRPGMSSSSKGDTWPPYRVMTKRDFISKPDSVSFELVRISRGPTQGSNAQLYPRDILVPRPSTIFLTLSRLRLHQDITMASNLSAVVLGLTRAPAPFSPQPTLTTPLAPRASPCSTTASSPASHTSARPSSTRSSSRRQSPFRRSHRLRACRSCSHE